MKLSERITWNVADNYILQCVGFPIERIAELNEIFSQMEGSLFIHVCSLAEPILLEREDYSDLLCPRVKLLELQQHIEVQFNKVSLQAKSTLWTILAQYIWKYADQVLCDIKHEHRLKDPELGEFFRLLEEAKKNGLYGGFGLLK